MTPQYIIEICVAIDIAILGIAYPIIIDKISNIGEKYSSENVPVLFSNEFPEKAVTINIFKKNFGTSLFKLTIFATLFSFIFLIFRFEPLFGWNNWFINNSADLVVFVLTTTLVILFLNWLGKVLLYNGKSKSLLTHIIYKYNKEKPGTQIHGYSLKAINEFTYYAIGKQDEHLQETLLKFYSSVFRTLRKNHDNSNPLVYPIDLYFLVSKLNEITVENETKLRAIEHRAVSGVWLLGEDFEEITLSEETYGWLWRNIYNICDTPRLVKMFWANSSQYFDYRLKAINQIYDQNQKIVNINQVTKRSKERIQFQEFHYALGGLLLYRHQYLTLKYIFEYSQSIPPNYVLLPDSMGHIFYWFEHFSNEYKHNIPIDSRYYFPELDNLGNRRQVNHWICCYITVLFIRQYTLHQYYVYQNFTALPNLPDNVIELSRWLGNVSYFESCLNEVISNKKLLAELGFTDIVENKKGNFSQFIKRLQVSIKEKIGRQKLNAELSAEKVNHFYTQSNQIITEAFEAYKSVFVTNGNRHSDDDLKLSIIGERNLISKSAFVDNDIPHLNYDSMLADAIATNIIKRELPNAFFAARTQRYLLNENNVLAGLSKIIGNQKDILIVGVSINYDIKEVLDASKFKNNLQYIPSSNYFADNTLFILHNSDIPVIEYKELKKEEIEKHQLQPINEALNLYASVIDLNKEGNENVKKEWKLDTDADNQEPKVQITISFVTSIYWKKDSEIIQVDIASEYREQGIQNDINDVQPIRGKGGKK